MLTARAAGPALTADTVAARTTRAMATLRPSTPRPPAGADDASRAWLAGLRAAGPERERSVAALRELLLRAARFEVNRRRGAVPRMSASDLDDVVQQSADDALLAILRKLDDYRGESRFTTWAYKFALLEASVKMRRLAWRGREVAVEAEHWNLIADRSPAPPQRAETNALLAAVTQAIETQLTAHQREILVAVTLNDVPIDVLAERLNTNRGALYKTLHDARRKLRDHLTRQGLELGATEEVTNR